MAQNFRTYDRIIEYSNNEPELCRVVKTKFSYMTLLFPYGKVQVGIDHEKAESLKYSHSKNRVGKKLN